MEEKKRNADTPQGLPLAATSAAVGREQHREHNKHGARCGFGRNGRMKDGQREKDTLDRTV